VQSRVMAGNTQHRELDRNSEQHCSRCALVRAHLRPVFWLDLATFVVILGASRLVSRMRTHDRSVRRETCRPACTSAGPSESRPAAMLTRHLGLPVSLITWSELEKWTRGAVARGEGETVCTLAPYQAYLFQSNSRYASVLERASIVLVDGNGVRFALSVAGLPIKGRLTGREVVQRVFDGVMLAGLRIAAVGSLPASQHALVGRRPDWLVLGGTYPTEPTQAMVAETAALLREGSIDVVFVALGCPKQELWADALARLYPCVYFSIGGAVDTVVGTKIPPPSAIQHLSLEWAWRLAQDPALVDHLARGARVMPSILGKAVLERFSS
jgi:N-acetylglucosaminyldiphosphoundecaprenol N-acetyl-beta-D-mannosaminyltransferase